MVEVVVIVVANGGSDGGDINSLQEEEHLWLLFTGKPCLFGKIIVVGYNIMEQWKTLPCNFPLKSREFSD